MKKYELTDETIEFYDRTLHRIRACRDFVTIAGEQVKTGDLGGFVETEENLSHDGMCWVYGDARVYGDAKVYGDARVYGDAKVYGNSKVYGNAEVYVNAEVYGDAEVWGDADVWCRE